MADLVGVVRTGDNVLIDYKPKWFPFVLCWCKYLTDYDVSSLGLRDVVYAGGFLIFSSRYNGCFVDHPLGVTVSVASPGRWWIVLAFQSRLRFPRCSIWFLDLDASELNRYLVRTGGEFPLRLFSIQLHCYQ